MLKTSSPVSPFAVIPTVLFLIIAVMLLCHGTVIKTSTYVTGEKNIETKTPDGVISFEGYQKDGTRTRIIYLNNPGGERSDRFYENLKTGEANIELGNLAEE